jgi:DNA-binding response OmpR family regulator
MLKVDVKCTDCNAKKTILVVDDNPANLHLLSTLLTEAGYDLRPAITGGLALAAMKLELPDLILLDVKMPEMDGYEVCRRLKSDERTRGVPVIFVSALEESLDKVRAFSVGGVDYITKPFQCDEVLARVKAHISLRSTQKHLEELNKNHA